ncbi:hypothetical protein AURANDRAFT_60753 [Aureococcus anophagefferens]|uniref:RING-type domain-containing protein n=1 Tax=Aureococcus anophagefferens TaxID=44056 RepID=F0XW83_AURAN|nr:hypothetical protein AURANDRAFT_60753 [Aureococcus anophagefferens]EGB13010.1 hypothetical protein AURANDRAFT_60753 [Aureococcus anophagefferens]|eukprot:XP_009032620.1 hypothetical protein AURANDRAFT_60753 [Aureococcus anophagefferens]
MPTTSESVKFNALKSLASLVAKSPGAAAAPKAKAAPKPKKKPVYVGSDDDDDESDASFAGDDEDAAAPVAPRGASRRNAGAKKTYYVDSASDDEPAAADDGAEAANAEAPTFGARVPQRDELPVFEHGSMSDADDDGTGASDPGGAPRDYCYCAGVVMGDAAAKAMPKKPDVVESDVVVESGGGGDDDFGTARQKAAAPNEAPPPKKTTSPKVPPPSSSGAREPVDGIDAEKPPTLDAAAPLDAEGVAASPLAAAPVSSSAASVVANDDSEDACFDALASATTCRLCENVLDEDLSCLPCGHCFCTECVLVACVDEYICPECRVPFFKSDITPNYAMRDFARAAVSAAGFALAARWGDATHLVSSVPLRRTPKLLTAVSVARHVVTLGWLWESDALGRAADERPFAVRDRENEAAWRFDLAASLAANGEGAGALADYAVLLDPRARRAGGPKLPKDGELKQIVECAGGVWLATPTKARVALGDRALLLLGDPATPLDASLVNIRAAPVRVGVEDFWTAVLSKRCPWEAPAAARPKHKMP